MTEFIIFQVSGLQQLLFGATKTDIATPPSHAFQGVFASFQNNSYLASSALISPCKKTSKQCHLSFSVWSVKLVKWTNLKINPRIFPNKKSAAGNPSGVASSFAKCSGDSHVRSCVSRTFQRSRFAHLQEADFLLRNPWENTWVAVTCV